nr:hypothetical protein [Mucilaginibacter sp. X4EP1]
MEFMPCCVAAGAIKRCLKLRWFPFQKLGCKSKTGSKLQNASTKARLGEKEFMRITDPQYFSPGL